MKVLTLTEKRLQSLEKIRLPEEVSNKEADIFYLRTGNWTIDQEKLLLKNLHIKNKETMANKLFTVSMLSDYENEIDQKELVIPKHLVSVNGETIGFTVKEKENTTPLGIILNDKQVACTKKIELIKKVGYLIAKMHNLKAQGLTFYFNDLHEYNFLIENNTEELYAIDLDSAALTSEYALPSYYMMTNPNLQHTGNKYRSNAYGISYPDQNSDLLCYNMLILNTLAQTKMSTASLDEYYSYVNYLKDLGFKDELIRSFQNIYTNAPNSNPVDYFNQMPEETLQQATYAVYQKSKK